jgi:hypothetical protein
MEKGLVNRFQFVEAPKAKQWRRLDPSPVPNLIGFQRRMAAVLHRIADRGANTLLHFDAGASDMREELDRWQHENFNGIVATTHERYAAHAEKMACRHALLRGSDIVQKVDMEFGKKMQDYVFDCSERLLPAMRSKGSKETNAEIVIGWFQTNSRTTDFSAGKNAIYRGAFNARFDTHELQEILDQLVAAKQLEVVKIKPTRGRPHIEYRLPND